VQLVEEKVTTSIAVSLNIRRIITVSTVNYSIRTSKTLPLNHLHPKSQPHQQMELKRKRKRRTKSLKMMKTLQERRES
jgi:hypothetical protein